MENEQERSNVELEMPISSDDHLIHNQYSFWRTIQKSDPAETDNYDKTIEEIGSFKTVEGFWALYCSLPKIENSTHLDYFLFRQGIQPLWEHPANINGGQWSITIYPKPLVPYLWEDLILAVIGEQFDVGMEICGVSLNVRAKRCTISVWNKTFENHVATSKIKDSLQRILSLPHFVPMQYTKSKDLINKDIPTTTNTSSNTNSNSNGDITTETATEKEKETNDSTHSESYKPWKSERYTNHYDNESSSGYKPYVKSYDYKRSYSDRNSKKTYGSDSMNWRNSNTEKKEETKEEETTME
ncbi:hypothetical protein WA158_007300 [Blastocystis sp. Blastoise]